MATIDTCQALLAVRERRRAKIGDSDVVDS